MHRKTELCARQVRGVAVTFVYVVGVVRVGAKLPKVLRDLQQDPRWAHAYGVKWPDELLGLYEQLGEGVQLSCLFRTATVRAAYPSLFGAAYPASKLHLCLRCSGAFRALAPRWWRGVMRWSRAGYLP